MPFALKQFATLSAIRVLPAVESLVPLSQRRIDVVEMSPLPKWISKMIARSSSW
jgi:hypothetical protein